MRLSVCEDIKKLQKQARPHFAHFALNTHFKVRHYLTARERIDYGIARCIATNARAESDLLSCHIFFSAGARSLLRFGRR